MEHRAIFRKLSSGSNAGSLWRNIMSLAYATVDLYERAAAGSWWYRLWTALRGRSPRLLDLRALAANWTIREQYFLGDRTVPIASIRGSESRSDDFDAAFHPTQPHTEVRWRNVARAWLTGVPLPPVELIQVGEVYFVRDGHHRISVARALGANAIDARVTRWDVDGPLPWQKPVRARRPAYQPPAQAQPVECV
jgi:hypothetical protein